MGLNAAQKTAVEYLEGPLLVLAGPGTGKTQLLSEKVAYILQNTDTNPENILCLTFTESGAANMRERLRGMIKADALSVNIGTYHAFGREILAQYQQYSEEYTRVLDAAIDEVTQHKIVKTLLEGLPGNDILCTSKVEDVISVISEAKAAGLSSADLARIAEQNIADADVIARAVSPLLACVVPRKFQESYDRAYAPIFQLLQKYTKTAPILGKIERSIAGMTRELKAAMTEAEATRKIAPLTKWKDTYFEKDEEGAYRLRDRIANRKLQSVATVMAQYQEYLEQQGLYDFDDMIEEAVKVLTTDEGFKLTLEERYQFIMLDEFQDTNPSQFAIVKALTDYEKPLVMAVGDDDQAIYEFQGALSSNLTDFQEHYQAKVVTLTENYRSTQEILDFAHEVIRQAPDRFADKQLTAHRAAPAQSQIKRYEFPGADTEYAFVTQEIARLVKTGVPQSEIAVLAYKRKYFDALLPFLKEFPEIKIAYERRDDLLADPHIHQILTILTYANDLAQARQPSVQLLEILSFPLFNLPALTVVKMAETARVERRDLLTVLGESEDAVAHAAAEFLAQLVTLVYHEPLNVVVNEIVAKIEPTLADDYERYVFYENLAALLGKAQQHFGDKALKAADLLELVQDYEAANMMLTGTSPYRDAEEAVQILTAHKAKGLEFRYVFIIAADHTAWGKGKGNNNLLALPKNLTQIRHTGTTDSERIRVLYVALTRAKEGLIITNSVSDFSGKSPERLEYLHEYEQDGKVISPFLPDQEVNVQPAAESPRAQTQNLRDWLAAYQPDSPAMRAIYAERAREWRLSASALTTFIDIAHAGPQEFFRIYLLKAPRQPETEAIALGDLVHRTFEAVTNKNLSDAAALEFYEAELAKKDLPSTVLARIQAKGTAGLSQALTQFGSILRCGKAEVDFAHEKLVVNGVPVTGKIDHLVIDEATKTLEVYDFKTGNYHSGKWTSQSTLFKYMLQLGFYKLLLNASREFKTYRVAKAHILFVTPDSDGQVHDKVYEYNAVDEAELLSLVVAVYRLVVLLRFLDDPEIFVPPDPEKNKSVKTIQAFVELLIRKAGGHRRFPD